MRLVKNDKNMPYDEEVIFMGLLFGTMVISMIFCIIIFGMVIKANK